MVIVMSTKANLAQDIGAVRAHLLDVAADALARYGEADPVVTQLTAAVAHLWRVGEIEGKR
jgi:hypothetical protein